MQWLTQNWMWIVLSQSLVAMYARHMKREELNGIAQRSNNYRQVSATILRRIDQDASSTEHHEKSNHG